MRAVMTIFVCSVLSIAAGGSALAQHAGSRQEQAACSRDASRFCRKQLGDDNAVQQCLEMRRASLSRRCKRVFESHGM